MTASLGFLNNCWSFLTQPKGRSTDVERPFAVLRI